MQNKGIIATDGVKHECDGCIGCCDGTLSHNYVTQSGKQLTCNDDQACDYCGPSGCLGYDDRPTGCDEFQCWWKLDSGLPLWLNPKHCGFIILPTPNDGGDYFTIKETKSYDLDWGALLWTLSWANLTKRNIYTILRKYGTMYFENARD